VLKGRIPAGGMYPPDGQYLDEHAWAAIWLYKVRDRGDRFSGERDCGYTRGEKEDMRFERECVAIQGARRERERWYLW
jgi:hypothetical protein